MYNLSYQIKQFRYLFLVVVYTFTVLFEITFCTNSEAGNKYSTSDSRSKYVLYNENAIINQYSLKDVMSDPLIFNDFIEKSQKVATINTQNRLLKSNLFQQHEDYMYAHKYTMEDILNNPSKVQEFLDTFCKYESKFVNISRSTTLSMSYDGYWLNSMLDVYKKREWSAASKEAEDLAYIIKTIVNDPIAVKLTNSEQPLLAKSEAVNLARKKIQLYLQFNKEYPVYGGNLPWFKPMYSQQNSEIGIQPASDWLGRFPTLDNGEFFWMIFITWHVLDKIGENEIANLYKEYFKIIRTNLPNVVYNSEKRRIPGIVGINDINRKDIYKNNYYDYQDNYYLNDMYEGFMMITFMCLFTNLPGIEKGNLLYNVGYKKIELNKNENDIDATMWKGFWNSSHEEWAWMFLPFIDNPIAKKLFDVRQKIRSIKSEYGYNTSINTPGREGYTSDCGIPYLPSKASDQIMNNPDIYSPSAVWPIIANDMFQKSSLLNNSYGLAAFLHTLQPIGFRSDSTIISIQGPLGFIESYDKSGNISLLKTVDGSFLIYLSLFEGGGVVNECRDALKNTSLYNSLEGLNEINLYDSFMDIWNNEINDVFGSDLLKIKDPGYFKLLQNQVNLFEKEPIPTTFTIDIIKDVWKFPKIDDWHESAISMIDSQNVITIKRSSTDTSKWSWVSGGTIIDIIPIVGSNILISGTGEFQLVLESRKDLNINFKQKVKLIGDNKYIKIDLSPVAGNQYFFITLDEIWDDVKINKFIYNPDVEFVEPPSNVLVFDIINNNGYFHNITWKLSPSENSGKVQWYKIFRSQNPSLTNPIPITSIVSVDSLYFYEKYYTVFVDSVRFGTNEYKDFVPSNDLHYYYWLQSVGEKGESDKILATSSLIVNDIAAIQTTFCLKTARPNPFNPTTTIEYSLQRDAKILLRVYNISGQIVATLADEKMSAGNHSIMWEAKGMPSGVYIYTLKTDQGFTDAKKVLLIK